MAHFAELNSSSVVLQVVVISNDDVAAHGGDESTEAEDFVKSLVPFSTGGTSWKQTSYNNNFRKQYAGPGYSYDVAKDMLVIGKHLLLILTKQKKVVNSSLLHGMKIILDG